MHVVSQSRVGTLLLATMLRRDAVRSDVFSYSIGPTDTTALSALIQTNFHDRPNLSAWSKDTLYADVLHIREHPAAMVCSLQSEDDEMEVVHIAINKGLILMAGAGHVARDLLLRRGRRWKFAKSVENADFFWCS